MNEDALNQAGILLNFIAGFLLSPQLIGIRNISHFERWIESNLATSRDRLYRVSVRLAELYQKVDDNGKPLDWKTAAKWVVGAALLVCGLGISAILKGTHLRFPPPPSLPAVPLWHLGPWLDFLGHYIEYGKLLFGVVITMYCAFFLTVFLISHGLHLFVKRLEGDDRLFNYLTPWGVFFFIVGNALQFAATLHLGK